MKKSLVFLLLAWLVTESLGQVVLLRPYKPEPAAAAAKPVTYYTSTTPVTYNAPAIRLDSVAPRADSRRSAAVAKVKSTQKSAATAKGLGPATYNYDPNAPVQYATAPDPSTTVTVNGEKVYRDVRPGYGQVGNDLFTPVSQLHYVQFAVYCKDTPVDKAPAIDGLYLLWHPGSFCPGGEQGASYIVKGYTTREEAKAAVQMYKAMKIDCWYNPALTGAEVEIIGVR